MMFISKQNPPLPPFCKGGLGGISKFYTFMLAAIAISFSLMFINSGEAKKPKVARSCEARSKLITKKELKSVYSQMYCTKCGDKSERVLSKCAKVLSAFEPQRHKGTKV